MDAQVDRMMQCLAILPLLGCWSRAQEAWRASLGRLADLRGIPGPPHTGDGGVLYRGLRCRSPSLRGWIPVDHGPHGSRWGGRMNMLRIAVALGALNLAILVGAAIQARPAGAAGRRRYPSGQGSRAGGRGRQNPREDRRRARRRGRVSAARSAGHHSREAGSREGRVGLLLANDATEPGVHILAKAEGSSIRVVNKDGRQRVIAP